MTTGSSLRPPPTWPARGLSIGLDLPGARHEARVVVVGELEMDTAATLLGAFVRLTRDGYRDVEVDLSGVPFCDVAGWRALLRGQEDFRRIGGHLSVRYACWSLRRLQDLFELEPPAGRA